MIRIQQLKLPISHTEKMLYEKAAKMLRIPAERIEKLVIVKQSIDARKKNELLYSYVVDVKTAKENQILSKLKGVQISKTDEEKYHFPTSGSEILQQRPVIVGSGPAGLFCGLMLARHGYRPLILERGEDVDSRKQKVEHFWKTGELNRRTNVQFGEGGAGTFSDGKLNTLVKDAKKRNQKVLELFVEAGADSSILYVNKPHIGTDVLMEVVKTLRTQIIEAGGEVRFLSQVTDVRLEQGEVRAVEVNHKEWIPTQVMVLAVGHSARDTFQMLLEKQVPMLAKSFAVGLRVQHPQQMINLSQYGDALGAGLGAASYKLTHQASTGRGIYSFCMCPGGYVVNASSEEGRLAVNGMSYHKRDGVNANSALIVSVTPADFSGDSPLAGVEFQRKLEEAAFSAAGGKIPVQLYGDFKNRQKSRQFGEVEPAFCGDFAFANLREVLPEALSLSLIEGMEQFERQIHGFSRADAILAGVESRTSSPVRIDRNTNFESLVKGLFPCGEGAGYAGGITSAAMDGLKVAEEIATRFAPL